MGTGSFLEQFARKLVTSNSLPDGVSIKPDESGGLSGFLKCKPGGSPRFHAWNAREGVVSLGPLVYISWLAHTKMWFYTMRCPVEIKWLLSCYEFQSEGQTVILVADALLPEQTCSRSAVVVSSAQDGKFRAALFDDPETERVPDTLWEAGHSHHRMFAYTSGDDAQEIISALQHEERFLLRIITNKYNELHCAVADSITGEVLEGVHWFAETIRPDDRMLRSLEKDFVRCVTFAEPGHELIPRPNVISVPQLKGEVV